MITGVRCEWEVFRLLPAPDLKQKVVSGLQDVQLARHSVVHDCAWAAPLKATASCLQPAPACSPTPLCALDACRSAEALSVRQREAVDQICSELLGSAEIVR